MSGIRTVIVTTPAMLRDLVKGLARGRVDLDIVAELKVRRGLTRRLAELRPELVIIGLRAQEGDPLIQSLLATLPRTRFVAFSANRRAPSGFDLRLYKTDFADLPPARLIDFMRGITETGDAI